MTFRHWPRGPRLSFAATVLLVAVLGGAALLLAEAPVALGAPRYQTEPTPAGAGPPAAGQTGADDVWSQPVNLSRSGTALDPQVVVDAAGVAHIIWQDNALNTFFYVRHDENGRSDPVPVAFPFRASNVPGEQSLLYSPELVADSNNFIHAFWTVSANALFHSRVSAESITEADAWSSPQLLDGGSAQGGRWTGGISAAGDDEGGLHVSYIYTGATAERPSGVYYRHLPGNGSWTEPTLLYESSYFRSQTEVANPTTQTQIAVGPGEAETLRLYVGWGTPRIEKLFLAQSKDTGQTWQVTEVDARQGDDPPESDGPNSIRVAANGRRTLVTWKATHSEGCSLYYLSSIDGGESWNDVQTVDELPDCPGEHALMIDTARVFLLAAFPAETLLLAWNGEQWSKPQQQEPLTGFVDPETYRSLNIGCHRVNVVGSRLLAVGCAMEEQDVWLLERSMVDVGDWFSTETPWTEPAALAVPSPPASITGLQLLADVRGSVHAFWNQSPDNNDTGRAIYYRGYDGSRWTPPEALFNALPAETVPPKVAMGQGGRFFAVWIGQSGEMTFSQTDVTAQGRLTTRADWTTPQHIPVVPETATNAAVALDAANNVYVAYTIPVNDDRGLYVTTSGDAGATWSEPVKVMDAASAGWDVVGAPTMAVTGAGVVHILWTRQRLTINREIESISLHYTYSDDGGRTFAPPRVRSDETILWYDIVAIGEQLVHHFWQAQGSDGILLWHSASDDGGATWSTPTVLDSGAGTAVLTPSKGQTFHLLQIRDDTLQHDTWQGAERVGTELVRNSVLERVEDVGAAFDGSTLTLVAAIAEEDERGQALTTLFAMERQLEETSSSPAEAPSAEPATVVATATTEPTLTPTPTPTETATPESIASSVEDNTGATSSSGDAGGGADDLQTRLIAGIIPALLIIVVVLLVRTGFARVGNQR